MFQGLVHHFKLLIPHFICFNSRFRWLTHLNLQFIPTRDRPASASHDPWGCKLCFAGRNSIAVAAVELHMNWCHLWVYTDISLHVYMYTHVHSRKDTPYKTNEHIKTFHHAPNACYTWWNHASVNLRIDLVASVGVPFQTASISSEHQRLPTQPGKQRQWRVSRLPPSMANKQLIDLVFAG